MDVEVKVRVIFLVTFNICSFVLSFVAVLFYVDIKEHKKTASFGVMSLLAVNMLQLTITLPCYIVREFPLDVETAAFMRDIFLFSYFVFTTHAATFSLLLLSVDRVVSLRKPLMYTSIMNARNITRAAVATGLVIVLNDLIPYIDPVKGFTHFTSRPAWSIATHCIGGIIPFILLLTCWLYVIWVVIKQQKSLSQFTRQQQQQQQHRICRRRSNLIKLKVTQITLILLGSYLVLYFPATVYYSLESVFPPEYKWSQTDHVLRFTFKLLPVLFTMVTPPVVCWRKKFCAFLKKYHPCHQKRMRNTDWKRRSVVKSPTKVTVQTIL